MRMPDFDRINALISMECAPYLLEEKELDVEGKILNKYMNLFITLKTITERLERYEIYFEKFFPVDSSLIPDEEVLEYHAQNYISDLFILREKLLLFSRTLRKDLKKVTVIKSSVDVAFDVLDEKIYSGFKQVSDIRNSHVHHGNLFADYKISSAKALRKIYESGFVPSEYDKEKLLSAIQSKINSHVEESKLKWIEDVKSNNQNVEETTNQLFLTSEEYILTVCNIKKDEQRNKSV